MTAVEIATGIIDKLQEENRVCLEKLHRAQDAIKKSDVLLAEKDRLIKILENRLRSGTDGILETTNRQRELTIKHLELQIQKLLKENEELEHKIDTIKAEICSKCETKLLLRENDENKGISKSYKLSSKTGSVLIKKKATTNVCPNRIKSLEKIIEHKDKRIMNLSKEVQRLNRTEKELTQKMHRLTKLLPKSHLQSETLTDCLLKEIQLLEAQKQSDEKFHLYDELNKIKSKSTLSNASSSKVGTSSERLDKGNTLNRKKSTILVSQCEATTNADGTKVENEILYKRLQKLCNDVNDLKHLFMYESEKLSHGLNNTAKEYDIFKQQLEEIINNLSDVAERILNINYFNNQHSSNGVTGVLDDKYVISCLQERLKDTLIMVTENEKEKKILNENLNRLKKQLSEQNKVANYKKFEENLFKSDTDVNIIQNIEDVEKLKEIIKLKEQQLRTAESHINTCQKFIAELQKAAKHTSVNVSKMTSNAHIIANDKKADSSEQQNKALQTKLNVAEINIKNCENLIEKLQKTVKDLEDENERLELELHVIKNQKIQEGVDIEPKSKFSSSDDAQISTLKKLNQELQDKTKKLEKANSKLEADNNVFKSKYSSLEVAEQEKAVLKTCLNESEKQVYNLEKNVQTLKDKLIKVENNKNKLENDLKEVQISLKPDRNIAELRNKLSSKEDEITTLKESLHTLENKALEMKHYRKSLHQEIENLCNTLMENEDSEGSTKRKTIYKAAVLHSAQALLRLDDNFNMKPDDSSRDSALDEMKHQIQVYLTEVSRIHELVTIKEQERDELLREYLDLNNDVWRPSSSLHHDLNVQGEPVDSNLQSFSNIKGLSSSESDNVTDTRTNKAVKFSADNIDTYEALAELKLVQEELVNTKSVTNYLLTSCTRLEDLLAEEKTERAKCERELEVYQETIKDLKCQLSMKENVTKSLNTLMGMMRSAECNNEITLEQLKSDINWLMDENQKRFERITATQLELCQCKEENSRIQNDLDSLKRQLCNEKYENAKVNNELRRLRLQISQPVLTSNSAS